MARPYSQDLRDRVIEATGNGTSARQAAVRFDVGGSTAIKWVERLRNSGERSARRQGRRPSSKLDAHRDFLLAVIEAPRMPPSKNCSAGSSRRKACVPAPARSGPSSIAAA